jgi:hypothetical protein
MHVHAVDASAGTGVRHDDGHRNPDAISLHRLNPAELADGLLEDGGGFRYRPMRFQRSPDHGQGVRTVSTGVSLCRHRNRLRLGVHDAGLDLLDCGSAYHDTLNAGRPTVGVRRACPASRSSASRPPMSHCTGPPPHSVEGELAPATSLRVLHRLSSDILLSNLFF